MFSPENTILLVIDVQGKLARLMHKKDELFRHISGLIRIASFLDIPIIVTEQVPEKIGTTISEITELLKGTQPLPKACFSCCRQDQIMQKLESLNRKQIVVAGIEAHVCVYQTVHDLIHKQYEVQVVGDAVSSRTEMNKHFALDRIKFLGGGITSTEMIACEWLKTSEHPKFREIIRLIK